MMIEELGHDANFLEILFFCGFCSLSFLSQIIRSFRRLEKCMLSFMNGIIDFCKVTMRQHKHS